MPDSPKPKEDNIPVALVRQLLAEFRTEVRSDLKGLGELQKINAQRSIDAHEATRKHVAKLTSMTKHMWRKVFGSEPPPADTEEEAFTFSHEEHPTGGGIGQLHKIAPLDGHGRKAAPLGQQVEKHGESLSQHDASIAGLQGQVIALSSKTNELLSLQKEQMGKRPEGDTRSFAQRVLDGIQWVFSNRAGQKYLLTLIAALSGMITAAGTTYALATGRLPYPGQSSPPAQYLPPPTEAAHVREIPRAPGSGADRSPAPPSSAPPRAATP